MAGWSTGAGEHELLGRDALAGGYLKSAGAHLCRAALYYHFAKFLFVEDLAQMRSAHMNAVRCGTDALPYLDPPGQGEAEYDLAIRPDWEVPGAAVIDRLAAEPGLDSGRVAVRRVSLGGYCAPRVASGDERVRACVALAGPYDFAAAWDQRPVLTREAFRVRSKSPDEPSARSLSAQLTLAGRAGLIRCPLLAVMGKQDRLIPWQQAERLVREAGGPAELLLLEQGNHGCANLAPFHRYRTADWVADQLGARQGRPTRVS